MIKQKIRLSLIVIVCLIVIFWGVLIDVLLYKSLRKYLNEKESTTLVIGKHNERI